MKILNKKRGWLLLAAILVCVSFLLYMSACVKNDVGEAGSEAGSEVGSQAYSETETTVDTDGKLVLALNGKCKVTVVTATYCTGSENNAATRVFNKLKNAYLSIMTNLCIFD